MFRFLVVMGLQEDKMCFCCFVNILNYDTVREGKAKLKIRPQ